MRIGIDIFCKRVIQSAIDKAMPEIFAYLNRNQESVPSNDLPVELL